MRAVLLTGAAGGLGTVMTEALLEDGHAVAAIDRDAAGLARLMERNRAAAAERRLVAIEADIADASACEDATARAAHALGRIEALVNNAGIGSRTIAATAEQGRPGIAEVAPADWDRFYAVNMRAPAVLLRAVLPHLRAAGWGRVVNVTTSYRSMLSVMPYGPSKAALEAMSAVWATELAPQGIGVAVLIPGGPTDTPFVPDIGMDRAKMLRPAIMGPPIRWLLSGASDGFLGRIIAARWDPALPPEEARAKSSRPIGWPELTADAVWGTP